MREAMWIFGYGSLIWRPGFPFEERRVACVKGYRRRFWQGSSDHRGVPGAPGRVVTLLPHPAAHCWGVAYQLAASHQPAVLAQLDHREKGGYERLELPLFDRAGETFARALVYVATADNPDFLGCAPLPVIAEQVCASRGPSGRNSDYVLSLDEALRELGVEDAHVQRLAALVRKSVA